MRISMSLVVAPRANNLSQLNTVTEIKYSNRNSTARDHAMIAVRSGTPVHAPVLSSGTVHVAGKTTVQRNRFIQLSGGTRTVNRSPGRKARALASLKE
jgi:hypothetical protein